MRETTVSGTDTYGKDVTAQAAIKVRFQHFMKPINHRKSGREDMEQRAPNKFYLSGWVSIRSIVYRAETFVRKSTTQPAEH